jgi:hypothetical protein
MVNPQRPFQECFRRWGAFGYIERHLHSLNVLSLTGLYEFKGSHGGQVTEWHFLDGGIRYHRGAGYSPSATSVAGAQALRAVCPFFGIQQPRMLKGEGQRRPLSELLALLSG